MDAQVSSTHVTDLIRAIRTLLYDGLPIDADTLHHIDSAFGRLSPAALKKRLTDPEDCESVTLVQLIFSPDLPTQLSLEKTLCRAVYSPGDVEAVQETLREQLPQTTILLTGHRFNLIMPPDGVDVFVNGLHIDRFIPAVVARAISRHLPADRQMAVRVSLRNARIVYHRPVTDFLCRLFEHTTMLQPDLPGCVDTAASLLSAAGGNPDLFGYLGELKTAHARMLQQATMATAQLKHGNAETLILRGTRLFQIDPRETLSRMARIDAIALAVFGRPPPGLGEVRALSLDVWDDPRSTVRHIGRLFR